MASIFFRTIIIYVFLYFSIKLMGKRQIGELEVSELISALIMSEIASLPIADSDIPLFNAIIPILFIVSLEIIVSSVKNKSEKLKKTIDGYPTFIIYKGVLMQKALHENRLSVNELLTELRLQGVGSIEDVYYAVLEQNGEISVLERGAKQNLAHTVIIDGEVNQKGFKDIGFSEKKLKKELSSRGLKPENVFLMTYDDEKSVYIIEKEEKQ